MSISYSVLDLAVVSEGGSFEGAIAQSRELAVHAESWGYRRFWMAEHHNMAHIASSATAVLLGHIAEATQRIRVGAGGVMLPNHSPLIIAEQFGTLATLYPGRIDLGLGRAPGTDPVTAHAIRPERMQEAKRFPENVKQLRRYLSAENRKSKVRALPGEGTDVPLWILGSSTDSAYLAAHLGLPYVFASHFAPQQLSSAIRIYRERFQPSSQLETPYVMPCINAIVGESDEEAEYLATSMKQMFRGVVTGQPTPLPPPVEDIDRLLDAGEQRAIESMLACSFVGSQATVSQKVQDFLTQTGAQELMMTSYIYNFDKRLRSYRWFAGMLDSSTKV